jgi:hypothetical protein
MLKGKRTNSPLMVFRQLSVLMDKVREIWFCVGSSASVLLLIGDVAHNDGVHGHVEDVHEHGRGHVGDRHYQYCGCDEIRHLRRCDERVMHENGETGSDT